MKTKIIKYFGCLNTKIFSSTLYIAQIYFTSYLLTLLTDLCSQFPEKCISQNLPGFLLLNSLICHFLVKHTGGKT